MSLKDYLQNYLDDEIETEDNESFGHTTLAESFFYEKEPSIGWEEPNPDYNPKTDREWRKTIWKSRPVAALEGIEMEMVDHYGGEGQGESYYSTWKFTKDGETVYVTFDGWYQSYNGAEFEGDWFFVEPKEVVRTEYVKV